MKKEVFVYWSGGIDSTALIWKLLTDGYKVKTGYVKHSVDELYNRETNAISNLLKYFEPYEFEYIGEIGSILNSGINENIILKQLYLWITADIFNSSGFDTIAIGYIMNDDAISYIEEVKQVNESLNLLRYKPVKIIFPVMKMKKEELWNMLPKDSSKYVVWCENRTIIEGHCGRCPSCIKMVQAGIIDDISAELTIANTSISPNFHLM